jgi:RNA methyltransferase, TrmH family
LHPLLRIPFVKITSPSNPRIKAALKLRNPRERAEQGRIKIDGLREIGRALDGGVRIVEYFVCDELCDSAEAQSLLARLDKVKAERLDVTPALFAKIAYGTRFEGIVAVAEMPRRSVADLRLPERPLVAVLEGVEKPGNIGAVLRSADGAGISAVIVAGEGADLYNPNAIRASMGTVFTLPVCAASVSETLAWLHQQKLAIFASRVDGAIDYSSCDFRQPCAILLGSEDEGLSDAWRGDDITAICLPMHGAADSLNVSATAAVLFYEAVRQRAASR